MNILGIILNILVLLFGLDLVGSSVILLINGKAAFGKHRLMGIRFCRVLYDRWYRQGEPVAFIRIFYSIKMISIYWFMGGLLIMAMAILTLVKELNLLIVFK